MRTATVFNFLLEANLMASAAILLMIAFRKFLRKPLGNKLIYFLWALIAIRLLFPLALSNPLMNEFRPYFLDDQGLRPIAGQIKVRLTDAVDDIQRMARGDRESLIYQGAKSFVDGMYYGTTSRLFMRIYLYVAIAVLAIFTAANIRFRRRIRINRIEEISGKLKEQYLQVCKARKVKPIPVWFVDPLPSACLIGVVRPYIALPLTAAPQEAVHVLTHEICHYKGKDHWFSVLRLLCCVIHWFNPLVWVAAYMSRTDGELACDSRVVSKLSADDRVKYTNTLVLAASKRYAPGVGVLATGMTMTGKKLQSRVRSILNYRNTVKWLMVTTAVLASMALVAAFFTAEYRTYPVMPQINASAEWTAVQSLQSEEEAQVFAEAFLTETALLSDVAGAEWTTSYAGVTYELQAHLPINEQPVSMSVMKDGTIVNLLIPSNAEYAGAASTLYDGEYEKQAEVSDYIMRFLEAYQPVVANAIGSLRFAGEGSRGEEWFVSFVGSNAVSENSFWFTLQVMPQVRMVSYHMNSVMTEYLQEAEDGQGAAALAAAMPIAQLNGYNVYNLESENSPFKAPTKDAMAVEDALDISLQAIIDGYDESNLQRFYIEYGFVPEGTPGDTFPQPYWQFTFRNAVQTTDYYDVVVDAINGEILFIAAAGESNG